MTKQQLFNEIKNVLDRYFEENPEAESKKLEIEEQNFRVDSRGWKKIFYCNKEYKFIENPEGDIWEIIDPNPELDGEQLFTWDAAMRETKKAGKPRAPQAAASR